MELTPTISIPLMTSEDGTIRVGRTRVRLDTLVYAFNEGYTAEEIVTQYPALALSDVYAVIAYYLNDRTAVDAYIAAREEKARAMQTEIESKPAYRAFRQQLLERRASVQI